MIKLWNSGIQVIFLELRQTLGREIIDFKYFMNLSLVELYDIWASEEQAKNGLTPELEEFVKVHFDPLTLQLIKGDDFVVQVITKNNGLSRESIFMAATLYFLEAAHTENKELAWSCLCEVRYLLGFLGGVDNAFSPYSLDRSVNADADLWLVKEQVNKIIRSQNGKSANRKRNSKYLKVVDYAFQLAKEKRPEKHGWPSPRKAATDLHEAIQAWSERNLEKPLSKNNSENYVYRQIFLKYEERFNEINSS